jgi:hypothetical protein
MSKKQQMYPISGVSGPKHPRREIRDLQENEPFQFSLLIRAIAAIQAMKSLDENSPDYINKPNSWWQLGEFAVFF